MFQDCNVGFGNFEAAANSPIRVRRVPIKETKTRLQALGVDLHEVDEYNTSKTCSTCFFSHKKTSVLSNNQLKNQSTEQAGQELERRHRSAKVLKCHEGCSSIVDRDCNAAKNILELHKLQLAGKSRPSAFQRTKSSDPRSASPPRNKRKLLEGELLVQRENLMLVILLATTSHSADRPAAGRKTS